jgi:dihydrofolate reductase
MRRVCYGVAASLDGFIAGPEGDADWIIMDPEIDFGALFERFDTFLMGRRTFEGMAGAGGGSSPGTRTFVFSRTLRQSDHPKVTIVADDWERTVAALREEPGKEIWLFGGGLLFRSLLEARLVDAVEVAIIPVLLGAGIPLLPAPAPRTRLALTSHRVYPTGIVSVGYDVVYAAPANGAKRTKRVAGRRAGAKRG